MAKQGGSTFIKRIKKMAPVQMRVFSNQRDSHFYEIRQGYKSPGDDIPPNALWTKCKPLLDRNLHTKTIN